MLPSDACSPPTRTSPAVRIVMGHGLWVSRFGADPEIVNKKILLDGVSYAVVGVMPRDFLFPDPANFHVSGPEDQLWVPLALSPSQLANHGSHNLNVIARLKSGVTLAQAQTHMDGVARHLADEYPRSEEHTSELQSHSDLVCRLLLEK